MLNKLYKKLLNKRKLIEFTQTSEDFNLLLEGDIEEFKHLLGTEIKKDDVKKSTGNKYIFNDLLKSI